MFNFICDKSGGEITPAAGYPGLGAGQFDWGLPVAGERHFLSNNNLSRVRQTGIAHHFNINFDSIANISNFWLEIWRKNKVNTWNRIYQEDFIGLIHNGICSLYPSNTWLVHEGDYIGYGLIASGAAMFTTKTNSWNNGSSYYVDYMPPGVNFDWSTGTPTYPFLCIRLFMSSPCLTVIGDSLMGGSALCSTWAEDSLSSNDYDKTVSGHFIRYFRPCSGQNLAIGSKTSAEIISRLELDIFSKYPRVLMVQMGYKDVVTGFSKATTLANWETLLNECRENGVAVIGGLMFPNTFQPNDKMRLLDDLSLSLQGLIASYNAVIADARPYVGQFREGGDVGNLWDIIPAYNGGDGIHYNAAGCKRIAQAFSEAIDGKMVFV